LTGRDDVGLCTYRPTLHKQLTATPPEWPRVEIKSIRTEADYRAALKEIEALMRAEAGTAEGERLSELAERVEAYERKNFRIDLVRKSGSEP
jgi:hypothetical protein